MVPHDSEAQLDTAVVEEVVLAIFVLEIVVLAIVVLAIVVPAIVIFDAKLYFRDNRWLIFLI